ncbi:MAG: aspartate racemase [Congregibacter sp.]
MSKRVVGILGGMGPEATVDLMQRVIKATPAEDDSDHIRMLVDNNPQVPSRIKALIEKTGPSPAPVMIDMAKRLEAQGADFLAMPCNTAHHYYGEITASLRIPFLNITELAAEHIAERLPTLSRVGLLASSALAPIALYEPAFATRRLEVLHPDAAAQTSLMALIQSVKAGRLRDEASALNAAVASLVEQGAEVLLIACTELSIISDQVSSSLPTFDASQILAERIVALATE